MPFTKKVSSTIPTDTVSPPNVSPAEALRVRRAESSRARKRVEAISDQLDQVRQTGTRVFHETIANDDVDPATLGGIVARQQEQVSALESALQIAIQQEEAAAAALATAALDTQREVLRKHLVQLGIVGKRIDDAMSHLTQVVEELIPILNDTRGLGFDLVNQQLNSSNLLFKIKLLESCKAMPNCAQPESWFLEPKPWSASLPTPDQADHVR